MFIKCPLYPLSLCLHSFTEILHDFYCHYSELFFWYIAYLHLAFCVLFFFLVLLSGTCFSVIWFYLTFYICGPKSSGCSIIILLDSDVSLLVDKVGPGARIGFLVGGTGYFPLVGGVGFCPSGKQEDVKWCVYR